MSVITGGVASLVATIWIAITAPSLRRYRQIDSGMAAAPFGVRGWRDASVAPSPCPAEPSRTNAR